MAGLAVSTGAQAQCTNGTSVTLPGVTGSVTFGQLAPFGSGINALTSVIGTVNTAFLTNTSAFVSAPGDPAPDQQGGGVWVRGVVGSVDTKASGALNGQLYTNPTPVAGSANCPTTVSQEFRGFQAGHDIATLHDSVFGANWHFGVTGGYVESKFRETSGGSLAGNFQVPFGGIYAAFSRGNLFADAMARADFYQGELNDPTGNGIYNQRIDARGYSLTGNIGYRFDLHDSWFVEPSLGGVYSHVSVDPLDLTGTYILQTNPGVAMPGRVQIGDVDSELGRASVRVGTTVSALDGKVTAQPFVTASIYHEFADSVTSTISSYPFNAFIGQLPYINATQKTGRIGTYEQVGVGSAFQITNTGWLGYARVDYRTGENLDGVSGNLGLRYQLNREAGLESLKDAPASLKDGPSYYRSHDWNGLYFGDTIGGVRGAEHWRFVPSGRSIEPDYAGYLLSSQVGYNYQLGHMVAGVEGDFGFSNARGAVSCPNAAFFSCEAGLDDLGSVTGRLGYAWGNALIYAKGGLAFGEVTAAGHVNTGSQALYNYYTSSPITPPVPGATTKNWESGWTVGAGMEFALTDKWSAKAEYMHYDLGAERFRVDSAPTQADINTYGDVVRVGVNYHLTK